MMKKSKKGKSKKEVAPLSSFDASLEAQKMNDLLKMLAAGYANSILKQANQEKEQEDGGEKRDDE